MVVRRTRNLEWLASWRGEETVKIITGVRRCGKSTLLLQYRDDLLRSGVPASSILHLNFEDLDIAPLRHAEALDRQVMKVFEGCSGICHLLMDEIQIVDRWEEAVNSLRQRRRFDIVLTGSNSTMLASELATRLSGRYVQQMLLPFSLSEARELDPELSFDDYLRFGGFPGVVQLDTERKRMAQLVDLTDSILFRDILLRGNVADPRVLRNLAGYLFDTVGNRSSVRRITNTLNSASGETTRQETISRYIGFLEEAYLLYAAQRYDLRGKEILAREPKYYAVDPGIRTALTSSGSRNPGFVLENLVFLELLRQGHRVHIGQDGDREIDFVTEADGRRTYIQVSLSVLDDATAEREFRPLLAIRDNHPKYVISLDPIDLGRSGIRHVSAERFLMGQATLG